MAKKKKQIKEKKHIRDLELGWYFLIPLMFIVAIVPLITFMKVVNVEGVERLNWKGSDISVDFFSYYKSVWFVAAAFISFIILIILRLTNLVKIKKMKSFIPLIVYLVFVMLSFLFSDYKIVASRGFVDLFQGVWVLLGYGLVVFTASNYIQSEKHVKLMIGSFIFVGLVTVTIGLGQYFGHDIFKTDFGKYLILPEEFHSSADKLKFSFGEKTIYATMYNINYVGSFAAMLIFIAISIFMYAKGVGKVIMSGIFMVLMIALLIGSNSRAGMIGFAIGFVFVLLLFRRTFKRNIIKLSVIMVFGICAAFVLNSVSDGAVIREIKSMNIFDELSSLRERESKTVRVTDIRFHGDLVGFVTEKETLVIKRNGEELFYEDDSGNSLETKIENNVVKFADERYSSYKVTMEDKNNRFILKAYSQNMKIYYADEGFRMLGSGGYLGKTVYPDRLEFLDGYERFASSRGYIWSRSIPILKNTVFIGHGPDSYAIVFPQKDYVGKMNAFNNEAIIVDKPHNMYIQIGINTGVVSLLALLAVFFMYFIDSLKLYWKRNIVTFLDHIGIGCVTAMVAYLGAGFFNDQVISVAPMFYVLVGIGIAVNSLVRNQSDID